MTFNEAQVLLKRITYKEGWSIELGIEGIWPYILVKSPPITDVTDQSKMSCVWTKLFCELEVTNEKSFLLDIDRAVTSLEVHEAREWLMLDGKQITPQH